MSGSRMAAPAEPAPHDLLVETLAALGNDDLAIVAGAPVGERWVRLGDALADDTLVAGWLAVTRAASEAPERVGTMFLGSWLGGLIVEPLARSVIEHGRGWTLDPERLHVRPTDGGWFDGLAIEAASLLVGPDDPARHRPGVRVAVDRAGVVDDAAAETARLGSAVLAGMQRVGRLGAPAFWGALGDAIAWALVADATAAGRDPGPAFADGRSFMAAVGRHVPIGRARPSLVPVAWSRGLGHEVRRGTCCLWYQTQRAPDVRGEGFCGGCPRRDPEDQVRRWTEAFEAASSG